MLIPLPPLAEQRRIVARIEALARRIEQARGLRHEAIAETEGLWAQCARSLMDKLTSIESKPLQAIVAVQGGGTPSKSNPLYWDGCIPWVSPKDMKAREIYDSADHISEEAITDSPGKVLDPGAVLVVVRGMILAHTVPAAVLRVRATINQDMKALIPHHGLMSEYLNTMLWVYNHNLLALVEKSTHDTRKLETPKLLGFEIPLPSLDEQHRIVAYLDDVQARVDALKRLQAETAAELGALLPSVLDRAFRGEL